MSAGDFATATGIAAALRSDIRKGHEPSVPYARKWEIGGCEPIYSLTPYPHDGVELLSEGVAKLGRRVVPTEYGLFVGDSRTGLWVAANRSVRGEGPPDAYIAGRYGEKDSRYTVDSAEVVLTLLKQVEAPVPQLPADSELQVGFPGLPDRGVTYVGSWQWNIHGEARDDEFVRRAAHATLVTIRSNEALHFPGVDRVAPEASGGLKQMPVSRAEAEYMCKRYRILFGNSAWFAIRVDSDVAIPDAIARGERRSEPAGTEQWAKVPVSAIDGVIEIRAKGYVRGQKVSLESQLSDGRVRVGFVGSPAAAEELGLDGDQHMGWTGVFDPGELTDITVEETHRA